MELYKFLFIAPYEGMGGLMEMTVSKYSNVEPTIHIADLENAIQLIQTMDLSEYNVILSRGGTAQLIADIVDIPVVEISISAFDMLRAIQLTSNYEGKIAVVGFSNITNIASLLCELLQYDVGIFTIEDQRDLPNLIKSLKSEGYGIVLGDKVTTESAAEFGISTILLTSGVESINIAIEQAVQLCEITAKKQREIEAIRAAAISFNNNIVVFSEARKLLFSSLTLVDISKIKFNDWIDTVIKKGTCKQIYKDSGVQLLVEGKMISNNNNKYVVFVVSEILSRKSDGKSGIKIFNKPEIPPSSFDNYYSQSSSLEHVVKTSRHYADLEDPVIIYGEQGTGKTSLVYSMCNKSRLNYNPLILLDCDTLSDKDWNWLLESIDSPFMEDNLTIYIRHIHSLPKEIQKSLVAFLENTSVYRRNKLLFTSVAENVADLQNEVLLNYLINDLAVVTLRLPPLREHRASISTLASIRINRLTQKYTKQSAGFTPGAMEQLQSFYWENNLDQFKRVIKELYLSSAEPFITEQEVINVLHKEKKQAQNKWQEFNYNRPLDDMIKDIILYVLVEENMNQTATAKKLNISRSTLWRKLQDIE